MLDAGTGLRYLGGKLLGEAPLVRTFLHPHILIMFAGCPSSSRSSSRRTAFGSGRAISAAAYAQGAARIHDGAAVSGAAGGVQAKMEYRDFKGGEALRRGTVRTAC
jgi:hypothetical protein